MPARRSLGVGRSYFLFTVQYAFMNRSTRVAKSFRIMSSLSIPAIPVILMAHVGAKVFMSGFASMVHNLLQIYSDVIGNPEFIIVGINIDIE